MLSLGWRGWFFCEIRVGRKWLWKQKMQLSFLGGSWLVNLLRNGKCRLLVLLYCCLLLSIVLKNTNSSYLIDNGTIVNNSQKYRLQYWATRSSVCLFTRTAHSFARSLTLLTPLLMGQWMIRWLFCLRFFLLLTIVNGGIWPYN